MNLTGNTILITGGGSGIGRGLAEEFHKRGNKVIIAGRRKNVLDEVTRANPGIISYTLDVEDSKKIEAFAKTIISENLHLNVLINNAGIMLAENLLTQTEPSTAEAIVTTNLLGPIRLNTALLPHLLKQPRAVIMNVSSGLATVPLVFTPTYSATKAAIHSYTESLRYQLRKTHVGVVELTPPYVQTDLMPGSANNPAAMPLRDYISEVFSILEKQPDVKEICVDRVKGFRNSIAEGHYDDAFKTLNETNEKRFISASSGS
jgi:uncharacterized oxidoreductase